MKVFGIIVFLGVASCSLGAPNANVDRSAINAALATLVEDIREMLITGNETLGIPVLEPFESEKIDIAYDGDYGKIDGTVTNLVVNGLTGFEVRTLTFNLIGIRFTYCFNWPTVEATGDYDLNGVIREVIPIYGTGDFKVEVTDASFCGNLQLSVRNGYLFVRSSTTNIGMGGYSLKLTGVFNDEEISEVASAVITDIVPQIMNDFESQINNAANDLIADTVNGLVGSLTLSDLIGLITNRQSE